jgi:hypothetical protein
MFQSMLQSLCIKMEELKKKFGQMQTEPISINEQLMDLINRFTKMNSAVIELSEIITLGAQVQTKVRRIEQVGV